MQGRFCATAAGPADELDGSIHDLGNHAQLDLEGLGLEIGRPADDLLEILAGYLPAFRQQSLWVAGGTAVLGKRPCLNVRDEFRWLVDQRDRPDDQPHRPQRGLVVLADDVHSSLHPGQRSDQDVGTVDGGKLFQAVGRQLPPAAGVDGRFLVVRVGTRPYRQTDAGGVDPGRGQPLRHVPRRLIGGCREKYAGPAALLGLQPFEFGP
ncbi:hypothetical protein SRIMM317S_02257 [Streptomyces rimosus subsp. rimosus]